MKFVSEKIASKLCKLGFNEPCMAKYTYASENFTEGSPMSLYPHTQDFFKGPGIETCCNSDYENGMNANGNIPVICAPDYLTAILWIGAKHRKISLEEDGVYEEWVSAYRGGYRPGEPYSILEKNIDEALDDMLKK
jgi:hypothetical protein